ncbi:MAG: RNA polymerase sigma factor [Myxococcaceae bacterium]
MDAALKSLGSTQPSALPADPTSAEVLSLVERCKHDDQAALRDLYGRFQRQVAAQLSYLVPRSDVEDALQEVFVEVFRSIRRFEGRSAFATWLYRVAVHVAMRHRRKAGKARAEVQVFDSPDPADEAAGPADSMLTRERLTRAEALLEKLAPKKRAVLVLHDMRGMDASRIAEMTGSNVLTVRTRLFYARREFELLAGADPALAEYFPPGKEARR